MLIKHQVLRRIAGGEIDLVFRRWKRASVAAGTRLRTAVGVLEVGAIEPVSKSAIRAADARRAGYPTRVALIAELESRTGTIYKITVRPGGADPRIALRQKKIASADERAELERRLDRIDRASSSGPWTRQYLALIGGRPAVRAIELAESLGMEKKPFKVRVRKLKELGLTESLEKGYRLSPRGRSFLGAK